MLSGGRLALAALALFLFPIALAIAGSMCAGPGDGAQFVGGIAGLFVGMVGTILVVRRIYRRTEDGV